MDRRDARSPEMLRGNRRRLRRSATDAERVLWQLLRNRQLAGAKFRRQHQDGPFVLDFYCLEHGLAIELDGSQHAERSEDDLRRTEFLEGSGVRVLRFTNLDVLQQPEGVLARILEEFEGRA